MDPMRVVPERAPWAQLLCAFGGFAVGPGAAALVSAIFAPESGLLQGVSTLAFALVFAGGTLAWLGLGLMAVAFSAVKRVVGGSRERVRDDRSGHVVPAGYVVFPVLGGLTGITVGALAAVVTPVGLPTAIVVWTGLGLAYGALLWAGAHHGFLPFDPE